MGSSSQSARAQATGCAGKEFVPGAAPLIPTIADASSMVTNGDRLFFSTTNASVAHYRFGFTSPEANWPVSVGNAPRGLALVGSNLYGASSGASSSQGALFRITLGGPAFAAISSNSRMHNLIVGPGDVAYVGNEGGGGPFATAIPLNGAGSTTRTIGSSIHQGAFALGRGNLLYAVASSSQRLSVFDATTMATKWEKTSELSLATASVALDCARDASGTPLAADLGVLYLPGTDGKLYAIVVDSRGLESNAPWPKYQHDSRNTGNPATPVSSCP